MVQIRLCIIEFAHTLCLPSPDVPVLACWFQEEEGDLGRMVTTEKLRSAQMSPGALQISKDKQLLFEATGFWIDLLYTFLWTWVTDTLTFHIKRGRHITTGESIKSLKWRVKHCLQNQVLLGSYPTLPLLCYMTSYSILRLNVVEC